MKRIWTSFVCGLCLSILAGPAPAPAQSRSTTRLAFKGTTKITGGAAAQLPTGRPFVKTGPDVDVNFEIPGVSGTNGPARLPAADVPTPAGNHVLTAGDFLGLPLLSQLDQAIAPTGNPDGFNFEVDPPDQGLAVGNFFVVEAVNNAILVIPLLGGSPVFESTSLFFGLAPGLTLTAGGLVFGPDLSDPHAYFDAATGRFFVTETEIDTDPATGADIGPSHVYIVVSQTNDPTGLWNVFTLDVTSDGDSLFGSCPCFADNPLIGADANGFYVSSDAFTIALPHLFRGEQLYAISKSQLETTPGGSITNAVRFHDLPAAEGPAFGLQPAIVPPGGSFESAANGTEYLAGSLDFTGTLDNRLGVWALTNTVSLSTTPDLSLTNVIITSEVYGQPPATDQKPGPLPYRDFLASPEGGDINNHEELVTANDDRLGQLTFVQGLLWTSLTTIVKPQGPARAGAAWFIIAPAISDDVTLSASVANQGYVSIASPQQNSVMFPSVGVNAAGGAVIAFSVLGENYYPSAAYALLDPVLGAGSIVISGPGVAPDDSFTGYAPFGRAARWGDYSAAVSDEFGEIWMGNEMIPSSPPLPPGALVANWGTFLTLVAP